MSSQLKAFIKRLYQTSFTLKREEPTYLTLMERQALHLCTISLYIEKSKERVYLTLMEKQALHIALIL